MAFASISTGPIRLLRVLSKGIVPSETDIGTAVLIAHYAIVALVGLTPVLLFLDNLTVDGFVELYAAVAFAIVAISIRPGEAGHWIKTVRSAALLAAVPVLWLLIQLLPLPTGGVSGSIVQTAGAALGTKLLSSITIDPGLTILTLCRYMSLIVIGLTASAVAIDRQQAERLFIALGCATFVMSLIAIVLKLGAPSGMERIRSSAIAGSIDGVVLFAAIVILIIERHLTRREHQDFRRQFLLPLVGAIIGFLVCMFATITAGSASALFAAVCGLLAVAIIQFVRRIGLGWMAAAAMTGVFIAGAAVVVGTKSEPSLSDFSSRYATHKLADRVAETDRIVSEVGLGGSGAGTFGAIYRLYAAQDTSTAPPLAPTSAIQIAIELGRPALWAIVALTMALIVLCGRGAFNRGRDFFYSTAGAGVCVATLIWAFCDIGLNNLAVAIVLAATLGLTFVQSISRTL